jgi:hypothetical protein
MLNTRFVHLSFGFLDKSLCTILKTNSGSLRMNTHMTKVSIRGKKNLKVGIGANFLMLNTNQPSFSVAYRELSQKKKPALHPSGQTSVSSRAAGRDFFGGEHVSIGLSCMVLDLADLLPTV